MLAVEQSLGAVPALIIVGCALAWRYGCEVMRRRRLQRRYDFLREVLGDDDAARAAGHPGGKDVA